MITSVVGYGPHKLTLCRGSICMEGTCILGSRFMASSIYNVKFVTLKKEGDDNDDDSILFVVVVVVVDIKRARAREREFEHTNKRSSAYHFARIETMTLLRRYVWFWHCVEQKTTMAIYLSLALSLVSLHDKNIALRHLCGLFLFVSHHHHDHVCDPFERSFAFGWPLFLASLSF